MSQGFRAQALTEKEKQTLRLMGRGHDAKSMARHLGLSVHTVNERLRAARRKLSVSSSREAARLLLDSESDTPDSHVDKDLGEAGPGRSSAEDAASTGLQGRTRRAAWVVAGAVAMSLILALAALSLSQPGATPAAPATASAQQTEVVGAAREFLALVDEGRWEDSWRATSTQFQSLNTVQAWTAASQSARLPLGAMLSRTELSHDNVPAPPAGVDVVKFRTRFANRLNAVETVSLVREDGTWKVVGIYID